MILKVDGKEFDVKFAYKPTIKGHLLKKMAKVEMTEDETAEGNVEMMENVLLFLPEFLLIGLQKNHSDEYGYDYTTDKGKDKQLEKAENLISTYADDENGDLYELYHDLQNELLANGFLAKMFEMETEKEISKKK